MSDPGNVLTFRRQPRFIREPFDEILPRGEEYIVKGLIPAHGVGFINGPSGSRKTFLALDWALRIAIGQPVLGRRTQQRGVIYVAAEAPNGVRKRVAAWKQQHGVTGRPFEMIGQAPVLQDVTQVEELAAEIALAADAMRPIEMGLVFIDTLAASIPGVDENAGVDMGAVMANCHLLASRVAGFVTIISHTGKDETRGVRGWSGQYAAADLVINLSRDEGCDLTTGRVVKLKEGEDGSRFAFHLDQVTLGADSDGDPITSAVVVYEDAPVASAKPPKQRALNPGETIVLAAVAHVTDHGSTRPVPASVQGARTWQKAVTRGDVKARAVVSGFADGGEKPNTVTQRFGRALQGIAAAKKVRVEGDLVWLLDEVTR